MMKKISSTWLPFAVLLFGCAAHVPPAAAQVTYTTPQTVKAQIANNVPCTGSAQTFTTAQGIPNFRNLGQTQHYVSAQISGTAQTFNVEIDGIDRNGNVFRLSDVLALPGTNINGAVTGSGSFDNYQVLVTCTTSSAHFTLTYAGTSATSNIDAGTYLFAQIDKKLFSAVDASVNESATIQTPFGSSGGTLIFSSGPATPTGSSTLTVNCETVEGGFTLPQALEVTLPAVSTPVYFNVPPQACPLVNVFYAGTGAGGNAISLEYVFTLPGAGNHPPNIYTHITGTTATVVNSSYGILHTITINTAAAGTISVFDLAGASCTGTPTSPVIAKLAPTATSSIGTFTYDILATNGICVQASVAMDITVSAHAP